MILYQYTKKTGKVNRYFCGIFNNFQDDFRRGRGLPSRDRGVSVHSAQCTVHSFLCHSEEHRRCDVGIRSQKGIFAGDGSPTPTHGRRNASPTRSDTMVQSQGRIAAGDRQKDVAIAAFCQSDEKFDKMHKISTCFCAFHRKEIFVFCRVKKEKYSFAFCHIFQ